MSTIVLRSVKGSPLTNQEVDDNFSNLNSTKLEVSSPYAVGDIVYANTTTTFAKLSGVATGNALISGGVGVAPAWGKVGLTTHVSGVLDIVNGGTGAATRQDAMDALAGAVTSGQYLRGNGTDVVMSAIQVADVPTLNQNTTGTAANVTGTVAIANGGTGATDAATARANLGAYAASNPSGYTSNTGTVTSIEAGTGLSGGTITTSGIIGLANTTVTAGSYTSANITVDAQGRITAAANGSVSGSFLPLAGGTMTGLLVGKNGSTADINAANDTGSFSVRGDATYPASMSFHRTGAYAINMGLSTANNFVIGGWSASSNAFTMTGAGALTMLNNITAYSDETLKKNWRDLPTDFVNRLAQVKHGIYDRTDQESTQVGVSAQSLRPLMPNAVMTQEDGKLSVAYGNAALVSAVQLAKRAVEQDARIAKLEAIVAQLTKGNTP